MSYKIIEKNGVKHKVWSSVEEDFLHAVVGGEQDTAKLFEAATVGVPTVLRLGLLDAYTSTDEDTRQRVVDFDPTNNSATLPEFTFLFDRLILCFDLKKHIPVEYHAKIAGIKKCIVTRESNFDTALHRDSYSNLTTSSILNLQQDLQFLVQEDYNDSIRLHDRLKVVGGAVNYALQKGEETGDTGKVVEDCMIGKTYVENGNTMTGYVQVFNGVYSPIKDAFFGLPECILEAICISNGNLVFHLYRPSFSPNVSYTLGMQNKGKEYEFNVLLDINDLI